jgi:DNA-directed RNA polymerase specialized sigma24 family protein
MSSTDVSSDSSTTHWIARLRQGDSAASFALWERYSKRMLSLGRKRLEKASPTAFDEEDVALSAYGAFCSAIQDGRYSSVQGRDDLWPLLATFTMRKANDRLKGEGAFKRNGRGVEGSNRDQASMLSHAPSTELDPALSALVNDEFVRLMRCLNDAELERLVVLKLDGHTNEEIAEHMGLTRRTIQRMLNLVRAIWQAEMDGAD